MCGKYPDGKIVDAIYDEPGNGNPFLESMPEILSKEELFAKIQSLPNAAQLSVRKRKEKLTVLSSLFLPMDYMYQIYNLAYRFIRTTYMTMNIIETTRQINALFKSSAGEVPRTGYVTQAECGAVLGVSGIGKTSTLRRCLNTIPQVILHKTYNGQMFYLKQMTYIFVECPSDCSIKTLGYNIANAVDVAIGSHYVNNASSSRSSSIGAIALMVKQICLNHHIGLIVIDEIQNAVRTAKQSGQTTRLIKFLVELMNDTCTAVLLVGTPEAEVLFEQEDHLKRRTRGPRLLPMKYGAMYRAFLEVLWSYQFTKRKVELTDKLASKIYEYSNGVPAYIIKIYQEAQTQAILSGHEMLDLSMIDAAAGLSAISAPRVYKAGTPISSYRIDDNDETTTSPRGRKAERREETDLLTIALGEDFETVLKQKNLLEVIEC